MDRMVNSGQSRIEDVGELYFPSPSPPLRLSSLPSPSLRSRLPLIQLGGLGERCKLPQRVRAEPGRQTHLGAF